MPGTAKKAASAVKKTASSDNKSSNSSDKSTLTSTDAAAKDDAKQPDPLDHTRSAYPHAEAAIEAAVEASDNYSKDVKKPKAEQHNGEPELIEVDFTYLTHTDPMRSLPGGVYLDDVERINAEIARAKVEDRSPDLENPPTTQSTPVQASHVVQAAHAGDVNVPVDFSQEVSVGRFEADAFEDDDVTLKEEKSYL